MAIIQLQLGQDTNLQRIYLDNVEKFDFKSFLRFIKRHFPQGGIENCRISYVDNEGDRIIVSTDAELNEAFRVMKYGISFNIDPKKCIVDSHIDMSQILNLLEARLETWNCPEGVTAMRNEILQLLQKENVRVALEALIAHPHFTATSRTLLEAVSKNEELDTLIQVLLSSGQICDMIRFVIERCPDTFDHFVSILNGLSEYGRQSVMEKIGQNLGADLAALIPSTISVDYAQMGIMFQAITGNSSPHLSEISMEDLGSILVNLGIPNEKLSSLSHLARIQLIDYIRKMSELQASRTVSAIIPCSGNDNEHFNLQSAPTLPNDLLRTAAEITHAKPSMIHVLDITVPDGTTVAPRTEFIKTWRVQNDGVARWPANCHLVCVGGDRLSVVEGIAVPSLQPGEQTDISVRCCAPDKQGRHVGYWRLVCKDSGCRFGHRIWVDIVVCANPHGNAIFVRAPAPLISAPKASQITVRSESEVLSKELPLDPSKNSIIVPAPAPLVSTPERRCVIDGSESAGFDSDTCIPQSKWQVPLQELYSMGFVNVEENIKLLDRHGGDINGVVTWLLDQ